MIKKIKASKSEKIIFIFVISLAIFSLGSFFLIKNKCYDPRVLNNLGSIYSQSKQFDQAIILYNESIRQFPNSTEAYSNLAGALVYKGRRDAAKKILNKAIE